MAVKQQQSFFTLKVEYLPKITIFGLKLMMKRGLEKMLLEFLNGINYSPLLYNPDNIPGLFVRPPPPECPALCCLHLSHDHLPVVDQVVQVILFPP